MAETLSEAARRHSMARYAIPDRAYKGPGLRWWLVSLVFLATRITNVDRLTISILAPVITQDH
jgi:hypothetical protein